MSRPNIVRADTLDLQDADAPSAAEHTKHPDRGIAPHQAAEYQHVQQERHSEEQTLADAWNMAGHTTGAAGGNDGELKNNDADAGDSEHASGGEDGDGGSDDDMMDRISSSPSIDDEDIDFEFVYALHTFVATVEGQANATKGDTMVLLDDSNSYWWLVRVVKDSSIGYLPAEHIETPTERLARLNKHRNIDLSQTMLGDNPEKSKNPLKKAIRRRNAKTVQFAAPTYVEASDYDYSSDEDEQGMSDPLAATAQHVEPERGPPAEVEERNAPEEANVHATRRYSSESVTKADSASKTSMDSKRSSIEDPQLSPKLVDRSEAAPLKSRKGTPRNADSFLKDESIETRKISLTPGILRDDGSSKMSSSESTRNNSLESLVKTPSPQEERIKPSAKDKKKDKKPGMLSGLFKSKKKDKKASGKVDDGEQSDVEKPSLDIARQAARIESPAQSPIDRQASTSAPAAAPASVLAVIDNKIEPVEQTTSRSQQQPIITTSMSQPQPRSVTPQSAAPQTATPQAASGPHVAELMGTEVAYEMATGQESQISPSRGASPELAVEAQHLSPIANVANMLGMGPAVAKPQKAQRTNQRVELDDFDSPDSEEGVNPFLEKEERERQSMDQDRLSASPVDIPSRTSSTFMHGTENVHIPQLGDGDDSHITDADYQTSMSTSPSLIERPTSSQSQERELNAKEDTDSTPKAMATASQPPAPPKTAPPPPPPPLDTASSPRTLSSAPTSATSPAQPQPTVWNDSNLRAWLDAEEVKDMLCIIHSTPHDAKPVGNDHPLVKDLFVEQRKGLGAMEKELDSLLGGFLRGRGVTFT